MNTKPFNIITTIHENMGYWDGRVDAKNGRKIEATDDAYFRGYRLGLTGGPAPNKYTIFVSPPELKEE
jgi:hypothetical protein